MLVAPLASVGWLAAIAFAAGAAKGLTGFGGALVMAPLFGLLISAPDAGALIVLVHCATSLQGVREWGGAVRWRSVIPLALVALVCTALTSHWIAHGNALGLRQLVACAVLLATALHMGGWRWQHSGSWRPTLAAGVVSGALTALAGLGGPPAVFYFSAMAKGSALRANLLGYFTVLFGGATLLLMANHQIRLPQLYTAAVLTPVFALGVCAGERACGLLAPVWFDRIVCGLLLSSGVLALLT
ncbi:sulfite exporter TauE/SafE family protein [Paraburkholderia sp.]|uniref:sulfite exporter TauE/SafE family protein n=1 Tax=Paraburkholderia sp. TaxID=1926495 RepID=UPI00239F9E4D|nr:sulfite exporter TauE/SafE family protein [Paraburkholderia sp.]MDE1179099.1 sulfite exporter TauE/SafE family protein [Paraburkholderia sp.]